VAIQSNAFWPGALVAPSDIVTIAVYVTTAAGHGRSPRHDAPRAEIVIIRGMARPVGTVGERRKARTFTAGIAAGRPRRIAADGAVPLIGAMNDVLAAMLRMYLTSRPVRVHAAGPLRAAFDPTRGRIVAEAGPTFAVGGAVLIQTCVNIAVSTVSAVGVRNAGQRPVWTVKRPAPEPGAVVVASIRTAGTIHHLAAVIGGIFTIAAGARGSPMAAARVRRTETSLLPGAGVGVTAIAGRLTDISLIIVEQNLQGLTVSSGVARVGSAPDNRIWRTRLNRTGGSVTGVIVVIKRIALSVSIFLPAKSLMTRLGAAVDARPLKVTSMVVADAIGDVLTCVGLKRRLRRIMMAAGPGALVVLA